MADTNEPAPDPQPSKLESLRAELGKRGVDPFSCPVCGADAWGGFAEVGIGMFTDRDPATGTVRALGAAHGVLASCGQCGFMCMFDRDVIGEFDAEKED